MIHVCVTICFSIRRERVAAGGADADIVKLSQLRKVYAASGERLLGPVLRTLGCGGNNATKGPQLKLAVQSLSFGIPRGECFGFLGELLILSKTPKQHKCNFFHRFNLTDNRLCDHFRHQRCRYT